MKFSAPIILFTFLLLNLFHTSFADTLYLKNGRSIEGIVIKETDSQVDLNVGFGTVTFEKTGISRIHKSSIEETKEIMDKWEISRKKSDASKQRAEEERQRSIAEWKQRRALEQEEEKLREDKRPQAVDFAREAGHMVVDAFLNDRINAKLLVDTGASMVILTSDVARKLGIDLRKEKADIQIQVADGRKVSGKYVVLKSLKIRATEAKNVEAAVLLDEIPDAGFYDGLLGMSFLKRFNFKFDYSNDRLILESR